MLSDGWTLRGGTAVAAALVGAGVRMPADGALAVDIVALEFRLTAYAGVARSSAAAPPLCAPAPDRSLERLLLFLDLVRNS